MATLTVSNLSASSGETTNIIIVLEVMHVAVSVAWLMGLVFLQVEVPRLPTQC